MPDGSGGGCGHKGGIKGVSTAPSPCPSFWEPPGGWKWPQIHAPVCRQLLEWCPSWENHPPAHLHGTPSSWAGAVLGDHPLGVRGGDQCRGIPHPCKSLSCFPTPRSCRACWTRAPCTSWTVGQMSSSGSAASPHAWCGPRPLSWARSCVACCTVPSMPSSPATSRAPSAR